MFCDSVCIELILMNCCRMIRNPLKLNENGWMDGRYSRHQLNVLSVFVWGFNAVSYNTTLCYVEFIFSFSFTFHIFTLDRLGRFDIPYCWLFSITLFDRFDMYLLSKGTYHPVCNELLEFVCVWACAMCHVTETHTNNVYSSFCLLVFPSIVLHTPILYENVNQLTS